MRTGETLLGVSIPDRVTHRIERIKEQSFGMTSFDLAIKLIVTNDLDEAYPITLLSLFADGQPITLAHQEMSPGERIELQLSDVSVSAARQSGFVDVLLDN